MGSGASFFRRRGLSSALALVAALTTFLVATPEVAPAQVPPPPATLYVDNSEACDDFLEVRSGEPYCHVAPAVAAAQNGGTVQVAAGVYLETSVVSAIEKDLTIIGAGSGVTTIDASGVGFRAMQLWGANNYAVSGLTITGGNAGLFMGGGVSLAGYMESDAPIVAMTDVEIIGNFSGVEGGGIENNGATLTLDSSDVINNTSGGDGGGIYSHNGGSVTVTDTAVTGNAAGSVLGMDQENFEGSGTTNSCGNGTTASYFQEFEPSAPLLSRVDLRVRTGGSASGQIVAANIREGSPTGPVLATVSHALSIPALTTGYESFTLVSPIPVTVGAKYLVEFIHDGPAIVSWYVTGDTYLGGSTWRKCGTDPIFETPTSDFEFRTFAGGPADGGGIYSDGDILIQTGSSVSGNSATAGDGGGIFAIWPSSVTVADSTIEANSAIGGAGIRVDDAPLTLEGAHVIANAASGLGGGMYSSYSSVTVEDSATRSSLIDSNTAAQGGGLFVDSDQLVVTGATISNNSAGSGGGVTVADCGECSTSASFTNTAIIGNTATIGGGLRIQNRVDLSLVGSQISGNSSTGDGAGLNLSSSATIDGSEFLNNQAGGSGGGIYSAKNSSLNVSNSEFSSNGSANGGALFGDNAEVAILDSTVSSNVAGEGAGLSTLGGTLSITGSNINNNDAVSGLFWDFENPVTVGSISSFQGLVEGTAVGDVTGLASQTGAGPALLLPEANPPRQPAAGLVNITRFVTDGTDSAGSYYPYVEFTNASPITLDSLSFEHFHNHNPGYPTYPDYQIQLELDSGSGYTDIGSPVDIAPDTFGKVDTVSLDSETIPPGTHRIRWTAGSLADGPDSDTDIDSNTDTEYFAVNDVRLSFVSGLGGGLSSNGTTVTIGTTAIDGNTATRGGGVYSSGFPNSLDIDASTISNNMATSTSSFAAAGGIYSTNGEILNSTISGNQAPFGGAGAIYSGATVDLTHVTVTSNYARNHSGGLSTGESQFVMTNSIVAGNSSVNGEPDCNAAITSLGNNIVGFDESGCSDWLPSDQVGYFDEIEGPVLVNPQLDGLGDNGGRTLTHALLEGSPAIDSASLSSCPATDQRGVSRPQGLACDAGAFETEDTTIPTELTLEIDQLAGPADSSVIPIADLNVGTFFGATEGPSSTQLGAIQLGAIQLGAIQLGAIGLADAAGHMTIGSIINAANEINAAAAPMVIPTILDTVTLVDIPVVGGWDSILVGTSLAGRPSYTVTLQQVIDELVDLDRLRDLRIADSGLKASQLGAIQLGAIQLGAIQLGAIQLGAIQLGAIGNQLAALCAGGLDCAALGINPGNSNSFDDYSIMALTLMGVDLDFAQLGAIQLGAIDPSGTQLGAIQLGAIQLGAIQLGAIDANAATIGNTQLGAIQLGAIQLGAIGESPGARATQLGAIDMVDFVSKICASGLDCVELGIDPVSPNGDELDNYSLLALGAMGADLLSTQLGAIQLGAIQLGAIGDLESTQLGAIQLGAIQLGAIDPSASQLGAIQLGAIGPDPAAYATQLGAIQLGAIDWSNPVFAQLGAIQLGAIQLGAIQLGAIQLGAIQLGAIQLGAIANPSVLISCGSLAGGCSGNGTMTLYELQELGLFLSTATLAELAGAMDDIPLSDLTAGDVDNIVELVGTATLLDLLPETTIADLPPGLTLGQLAELWVGMPVFELLLALLNPGELGWEDVDPAVLAAQHPAVTEWSVSFKMAGEPGLVPGAEFAFTAEASVNLPSGMDYVVGSAQVSVDGAAATPLPDPEQDGSTLQWVVDGLTLNSGRVITFDLGTAFTADTMTPVATTINTLGYSVTKTAPTIVFDVEPNDRFTDPKVADIGGDVVVLGRIGTDDDVDMYRINVPPGATIEAYLNPGGVDLDLVLFEPGQTSDGELRGPAERIVDGSLDPTIGIDPVEQDQESLADIANTDLAPVFKASLHRSTANEAIVTPPLREGGDFYLQVSGYNGATPDSIYVSRIRVIAPPPTTACAPRQLDYPTGVAGAEPTPAELANAKTLYLMNTDLFGRTFGTQATTDVLEAIGSVNAAEFAPAGVVVPVQNNSTIAAAYTTWLGTGGNCSVDAANAVASAIGDLVDGYRADYPTIQNIVIIGGDDQVPFFRVKDQGVVANEREYRSTFTENNPLVASLGAGMVLTDAPYSDPNPLYVPQGDREVFIPQLPTGRLVDQPNEIIAALAQYVASAGKLDTATASVTNSPEAQVLGYDFLADSSATIAATLGAQMFDVISTVSETWDKDALAAAMESGAAIVNVNAHFDHTAALPAAGNLTNTFTDLYRLADLLPTIDDLPTTTSAYEGAIIFTMGCHAGLNAADSYLASGDPIREWAQELLLRDAVFIGNTGFGYGDSDFEAYSEELMSLFAEKIGTSNTIGEAFVAAQQAMAGKTAKWSPYHDKSQMEATLYGLPFYQLHASPKDKDAIPKISTAAVGTTELEKATVNTSASLSRVGTIDGDYFKATDVLAVPFRPVQPLEAINVTPLSGALRATGAIIEQGSSTDLANFDVLYARPILYNEAAEPETETTGAFPNGMAVTTSFETRGGTVDQLLLARGRYFPSSRTQQTWNTMSLTVYYAPNSEADVTPPTIGRVSAVEVTQGTVDFEVEASDASSVLRVVVLYKAAGATGAWTKLELGPSGGLWTASVIGLTDAQDIDFFVQVLAGDGQVSASTDKAEMHHVQPPGPPRIQVVSGTVGNNGIYKTSVGIGLVGPANAPGAELQYAIDNGSFNDYTSGTTIPIDDGTHTVRARPKLAPTSVVTRTVVVDSIAPTVTVANPTDPGVKVEFGSIVPLQYFCADTDGSGIAKCKGTVGNGAALPSNVVGLHVAQVTATDKAGNTFVSLVPYEVVPEGPMTLTSDLSLVTVGTTVTFTAMYSNTSVSHNVEWDFDGDGDFTDDPPASVTSFTSGDDEVTEATFAYALTGVYPVAVRVTHGTGGYVQTEVLQYIVVYDPAEGFVTGGGWFDSPPGAYTPGDTEDLDIVGKAKFGFVSKYKKGASVPTGKTKFELKAGDLDFRSTAYEWMVISGKKAQYKGVGTVEGWEGEFNFRLTVMDADINPNDQFDKDTFRIEIWRSGNGPHFVLYDNGMGADPSTDEGTTELGGGSIKIHSGKTK